MELMTEWSIRNVGEFGGAAYVGAKFDLKREFPGLTNHRWRDSGFSTINPDGSIPKHPIYPVEEQALRWSALLCGADMLAQTNPVLSKRAREVAAAHKKQFNNTFVYTDEEGPFLADAFDGRGQMLKTITCDPILTLLPSHGKESIIDNPDLSRAIIERSFTELFDRGGLRPVSNKSAVHPNNLYQGPNSRWPHASSMGVLAIDTEAQRVRKTHPSLAREYIERALMLGKSTLEPVAYFGSPLETFQVGGDGRFYPYEEVDGDGNVHRGASVQAFSGAGCEYDARYVESHGVSEITVNI